MVQEHTHQAPDTVAVSHAADCTGCACERVSRPEQAWLDDKRKKQLQIIGGALLLGAGLAARSWTDNSYLGTGLLLAAYVLLGVDVIAQALKHIAKGKLFDENFLMGVATVGALALGDYPEAAAVMLFYQVGEYFQEAAVRKSKKSISDLMDIRPDYANLKTDGETVKVSPEQVNTGDMILIKPGEKIPLDGVVAEGSGWIDARSLTGESLPQSVRPGDTVLSGCINLDGLLTVRVTKPFGESTVQKIIALVENAASHKAPAERFITVFARYYTPAVVALAALLALVPPLFVGGWGEWIHRALVFLVISCPCALVISIPLGYFGGIGAASRRGVLVKGSHYLDALSAPDTVVFDKTGTLTQGVFEVSEVKPAAGFDADTLLRMAAYAEIFSSHPIARSIVRAYNEQVDESAVTHYEETAGRGVSATIDKMRVRVGRADFLRDAGVMLPEDESSDKGAVTETKTAGTITHISAEGRYAGCIIVSDTVRPDAREAIRLLKKLGTRKVVMLTGDNLETAQRVAAALEVDEAFAGLLPQDKVSKLEALEKEKRPGGALVFVGDGINDAPVLARADVGVAMGGLGSDAAIEAADVVLMTDEPLKLVSAVQIARKTRRLVRQNIVFALGVKGCIMLLGAFGLANMWAAVFADVGVALIAIINALRVMRRPGASKKDNQPA